MCKGMILTKKVSNCWLKAYKIAVHSYAYYLNSFPHFLNVQNEIYSLNQWKILCVWTVYIHDFFHKLWYSLVHGQVLKQSFFIIIIII